MKKTYILLLFPVIAAVSCQKGTVGVSAPESDLLTIRAEACAIGENVKVGIAQRYDVLWQDEDKIYVKDKEGHHNLFSLASEQGSARGVFTQDTPTVTFSGEVEAFYPAAVGETLQWPASQTEDQVMPMYCGKALSGAGEEEFNFRSMGGIMQLMFNTFESNVTIKSIDIEDGKKTLSGAFHVENGKAVIDAADSAGITLDLGDGVTLGKGARAFNVAVPEGNYEDLTVTLHSNGKLCKIQGCKLELSQNAVAQLVITGKEFIVLTQSVTLDKSETSLVIGEKDTETLTATVLPENATYRSVVWSSDKDYVATVDQNGNVTATGVGTATITATSADGEKSASCAVNVDLKITKGQINDHDYVQIGNGVKWATENIGGEYSWYFSWGNVKPYRHYYGDWGDDWYNMENGNRLVDGFTKSKYESTDGYTLGDDSIRIPVDEKYDAARHFWGDPWRIPSADEMRALLASTYAIVDKHVLYLYKPKEGDAGKVIYSSSYNYESDRLLSFHSDGYGDGGQVKDYNQRGKYWLSDRSKTYQGFEGVCIFEFYWDMTPPPLAWVGVTTERHLGQPIRPVADSDYSVQ